MSGFVAILICLVLSAFFSGMEIAFMASNKLRIEIDKSNKGITQKLIDLFVSNSGMYITTILVGNNVVMVIYGIFMSDYLDPRLEGVGISRDVDLDVDHAGDGRVFPESGVPFEAECVFTGIRYSGIFVLYPVFSDLVFLRVVRGIVAEDIYRTQTDA